MDEREADGARNRVLEEPEPRHDPNLLPVRVALRSPPTPEVVRGPPDKRSRPEPTKVDDLHDASSESESTIPSGHTAEGQ